MSPRIPGLSLHSGTRLMQRQRRIHPSVVLITVNNPHSVAIIGTSLVRGLGTRLIKRGIHSNNFVFPGAEIPALRDRIPGILNSEYQSDIVVLQCGGNDVENDCPPAQVIRKFDHLICEIKRCCPTAKIIINKIPPRGRQYELLSVISKLNTYLMNLSKDKRRQVTCSDACFQAYCYYQNDEIHFNHAG